MAIRRLLESHGYRLERAILDQDWYVFDEAPPKTEHQAALEGPSRQSKRPRLPVKPRATERRPEPLKARHRT